MCHTCGTPRCYCVVDNPESVLRSCEFFARLDEDAIAQLAAIAVSRRYRRNQRLAEAAQDPPGMFIVVRGQVRVYKVGPGGKEHVLHLAGPSQSFLEVAALGDFPAPASCQALEETLAILLPAHALRGVLASQPALCLQVLASMATWVRHLLGMVEDLTMRDAAGRFARYLLAESREQGECVELPSLNKHLASRLHLTSETFSRTLRRLVDAGLIELVSRERGAQVVRIVDAPGLEDACAGGNRPL